jgi:hypothetical protein
MRVKQWHRNLDGVRHDLQPVYYRKKGTFLRIEDIWYCEECDKMVDMQYEAAGTGRKILMSKGYTSMSERLHRVESKGERRGLDRVRGVDKDHTAGDLGSVTAVPGARLSSEIGLERLTSETEASPSPVPVLKPVEPVAAAALVLNPAGPVADAAPGARSSSEVVLESFQSWDKDPGTSRNAPCPCGSTNPDGSRKKYKRCCGKGAPSKEM